MMSSFAVTAASEAATLNDQGRGGVAFTVTNTTGKPVRAVPRLQPSGSTQESWLRLAGQGTRLVQPGESQNFNVEVAIPGATPPGRYSFRLNVSNEVNPDEDFAEGPAVAFTVGEAPTVVEGKKSFPWWILIVLGVVLAGGAGAMLALWPRKVTVPSVVARPLDEASNALASVELQMEVAGSVATGTNPIGVVVSQEPVAAEEVTKAAVVRVTVEGEREGVKVPDLVGVPFGKVQEVAGHLDLDFVQGEERFTGQGEAGTILDQRPAPGTVTAPGSEVRLVVEGESVVVPNVSQSEVLAEAANKLIRGKLSVGPVKQRTTASSAQVDRVIDQEPKAGKRVAPDTAVTLVVGVSAPKPPNKFKAELLQLHPTLVANMSLATKLPAPALRSPRAGAVFSHFPRKTVLDWSPVGGAKDYRVEIDVSSGGRWGVEANNKSFYGVKTVQGTRYTFNFVGAQPGRWRVWAVDNSGRAGVASGWREFRYTR